MIRKPIIAVVALVTLVTLLTALYNRNRRSNPQKPRPTLPLMNLGTNPSQSTATQVTVVAHSGSPPPRRGELYVDLELAKSDEGFREMISHHVKIKSYLSNKFRGTPVYESVLGVLLKNGYSVDQLRDSYIGVMTVDNGPYRNMRKRINELQNDSQGNPVDRAAILERFEESVLNDLASTTGISDVKALKELVEIARTNTALVDDRTIALGGPRLRPEQGERLLTDEDWMTEGHRKLASSYLGEARKPGFGLGKRVDWNRPNPFIRQPNYPQPE
jgi:hypothetical protein